MSQEWYRIFCFCFCAQNLDEISTKRFEKWLNAKYCRFSSHLMTNNAELLADLISSPDCPDITFNKTPTHSSLARLYDEDLYPRIWLQVSASTESCFVTRYSSLVLSLSSVTEWEPAGARESRVGRSSPSHFSHSWCFTTTAMKEELHSLLKNLYLITKILWAKPPPELWAPNHKSVL